MYLVIYCSKNNNIHVIYDLTSLPFGNSLDLPMAACPLDKDMNLAFNIFSSAKSGYAA